MAEKTARNPEEFWYPPTITEHEMRVGIIRTAMNGNLYISVPDFRFTSAMLNQDREQREREYRAWLYSGSAMGFQDWLRARKEARNAGNQPPV